MVLTWEDGQRNTKSKQCSNVGSVGVVDPFQLIDDYMHQASLYHARVVPNSHRRLASSIHYVKSFKVAEFFSRFRLATVGQRVHNFVLCVSVYASQIRHARRPKWATQWDIRSYSAAAAVGNGIKFTIWRYSMVEKYECFPSQKCFAKSACMDFGRLNLMTAHEREQKIMSEQFPASHEEQLRKNVIIWNILSQLYELRSPIGRSLLIHFGRHASLVMPSTRFQWIYHRCQSNAKVIKIRSN